MAILVALVVGGCGPSFYRALTPSGVPCPDMPLVPFGKELEQPYGRIRVVSSDRSCRTNSERMESLRRHACSVGADAVIEITTDEVEHLPTRNVYVIDGTAVRYKQVRR